MTLQIGDIAPDFTLADAEENMGYLSDFRGSRVILYFYPRDNTPGCTKEACGFRSGLPRLPVSEYSSAGGEYR